MFIMLLLTPCKEESTLNFFKKCQYVIQMNFGDKWAKIEILKNFKRQLVEQIRANNKPNLSKEAQRMGL